MQEDRSIDKELALQKFFDSAPMMMGIADLEDQDIRHVFDNKSAAKFFRSDSGIMTGKLASELGVPKDTINKWREHYIEAEKSGRPAFFEYEHGEKSFYVTVSFMEKNRLGQSRFSYIVQDITKTRIAEQKLQRLNIELEEKIRQRTEELKLQKNKLDCLVQSAPLGIAFLDNELRYEIINPVLARMNGKKPAEHISRKVTEVLPEYSSELIPKLQKVLNTGESIINWEYNSFTAPDRQHLKSFLANYFPVVSDDKIIGIGATVLDTTSMKEIQFRLEKERAFLNSVLEQLPIAVWILESPGGKLLMENSVARNFMKSPDELTKSINEYSEYEAYKLDGSPYGSEDYPTARSVLKDEVVVGEEMIIRKKDGSKGHAIVSSAPVKDPQGETFAAVAVAADISEQKNIQEEREQFVATLSHDLRTPLTAAKVSAQLITRKPGDLDLVNRSAFRIVDNMNRADSMIRDILDASRIKAGEKLQLQTGPCDLIRIVSETVDELSTVHGDRFRIKYDEDIAGTWSCEGIRRMTENLCSNAVKYGSLTDQININLMKDKEWAYLKVHNKGNPIPFKSQEILFDPYSRIETKNNTGKKGWGLGLTLVKGLAEAHKGDVTVNSSEQHGTTFIVRLPF